MESAEFRPHRVNITHGHKRRGSASKTYKIWLGMKARCSRPKHKDFPRYGAKGITVCPRWDASFEHFLEDMGEVPSPHHTIDRKNSRGNYQPGNCRWATQQEQGAENRSSLRPITVNGLHFHSILAAARHFGIGRTTIMYRLAAGKSLEEAISQTRLASDRSRESYLPKTHADRR